MYEAKRSKLWKQLMGNYFKLFGIIILLIIIVLIFIQSTVYFRYKDFKAHIFAESIMKDSYKDVKATDVIETKGWVECLDNNYKVISVIGHKKTSTMKYSKSQFYKMSFNEYHGNYFYNFAYNRKKDFFVMVAYPKNMVDVNYNINGNSPYTKSIIVSLCTGMIIFIFGLLISIFLFSKVTSKRFIVPLGSLSEGAMAIANGDYGRQVIFKDLNINNEIGDLKDAFNVMSKKLKEEIELKNKVDANRRQLILDMAHDLKNPITSAMGYSELIIKDDITNEEVKRYSSIIYNNCKRANMLAAALFEFSHLQSEGFSLDLKQEDICEFMREVIADYIPKIEDRDFVYEFSIPDKEVLVNIDKENLYRAVSNILDNSIKYNKSGTILKINLSYNSYQVYSDINSNHNEQQNDNDNVLGSNRENDDRDINEYKKENYIKILIEDNGIGIPEDMVNEIFSPFVRVDKARNSATGGAGLGLAIANMIVEKHGGTIKLESSEGEGCRFALLLPIY